MAGDRTVWWLDGATANGDQPTPQSQRILRVGRVSIGLISIAMVGLLARVVGLQTHPPEPIRQLINSQQSGLSLPARRGNLQDRHGRILATTRLASRLFIDPQLIKNPNTFSENVGYQLGYEPSWIERKINAKPGRRYIVIDPRLDEDRVEKLKKYRLPGLATERYPVRDYPNGSLAGQVIGFVGVDGDGLEGLERSIETSLRAKAGRLRYLRASNMKPVWVDQAGYRPPVDGRAVRLSLDITVQSIAESELSQACEAFKAESGQLIVMDPRTGEILAMANYPAFDPNRFKWSKPEDRRNRCVTDLYEPGSTFKPFIWAAATHAGLAKPDEIIDCTTTGYYRTDKGRGLHDAHGHGKLTWDQVLIKSSNIGMAIVGQRMGTQRLYDAVRSFGFGSVTGCELPGEAPGIVTPLKRWNHYSVTSVPMGQEIAVTALQLVAAFSAIVNDGYRVRPTIFAQPQPQPQSPDPHQATAIYERVLSPATAAHTRHVLRRVVTRGTGHRANSTLYTVFGKTGTAQVADPKNGGYLEDQYVSSFLGAAPLNDPRVTVVCIIRQPDKSIGYYGGTVAAPAVRRVIEQTLLYLGVHPDPSPPERWHARLDQEG